MPRQVPCPICKNPALFDSSNLYRPFCSERCQKIDLGQWASDTYVIAGKNLETEDSSLSTETDEETTPSPRFH